MTVLFFFAVLVSHAVGSSICKSYSAEAVCDSEYDRCAIDGRITRLCCTDRFVSLMRQWRKDQRSVVQEALLVPRDEGNPCLGFVEYVAEATFFSYISAADFVGHVTCRPDSLAALFRPGWARAGIASIVNILMALPPRTTRLLDYASLMGRPPGSQGLEEKFSVCWTKAELSMDEIQYCVTNMYRDVQLFIQHIPLQDPKRNRTIMKIEQTRKNALLRLVPAYLHAMESLVLDPSFDAEISAGMAAIAVLVASGELRTRHSFGSCDIQQVKHFVPKSLMAVVQ